MVVDVVVVGEVVIVVVVVVVVVDVNVVVVEKSHGLSWISPSVSKPLQLI